MAFPATPLADQFSHPTNPRSVLEDPTAMHNATANADGASKPT